MKVIQQEEAARQTVLEIELDDDDLEPYLNRAYRRVVQRASIPGFRKGKAPRSIIESYFGREYLINDVIDYMVADVTSKAIDENELDAGGLPRINLKGINPVQIEATVPLSPTVELNDYSQIRVDRELSEVTPEQVNERTEQMRQSLSTWEPVERATKRGDMVTIDINAQVDDRVLIDQQNGVLVIDEDHDTVLPGLSKKLTRVTKAKPKKFSLKLPDDYQSTIEGDSVAGKEAFFTVLVNEVKERKVPALDDEFAKEVGQGFEDMAALTQSILNDMTAEADQAASSAHKEAVVAALVESADLTIPQLLVDHEIDHILADREQALQRMNVSLNDYLRYSGKTSEEFKEETRSASIERLERTYVLNALVEAEAVEVGDDELASRLESLKTSVPPEQLGSIDIDSDEAIASMRRNLEFEKAIDRLVEIASGKDGSTDRQNGKEIETEDSEGKVVAADGKGE